MQRNQRTNEAFITHFGYDRYEEDDSDSGKSDFDEEYYDNKPSPIIINKKQIVVIRNDKKLNRNNLNNSYQSQLDKPSISNILTQKTQHPSPKTSIQYKSEDVVLSNQCNSMYKEEKSTLGSTLNSPKIPILTYQLKQNKSEDVVLSNQCNGSSSVYKEEKSTLNSTFNSSKISIFTNRLSQNKSKNWVPSNQHKSSQSLYNVERSTLSSPKIPIPTYQLKQNRSEDWALSKQYKDSYSVYKEERSTLSSPKIIPMNTYQTGTTYPDVIYPLPKRKKFHIPWLKIIKTSWLYKVPFYGILTYLLVRFMRRKLPENTSDFPNVEGYYFYYHYSQLNCPFTGIW